MSIIKLDETITVSAAQELNYVKSTMSDSAGKVKSAYHILAMDNTLTNAFNQSLITEIRKSADKLAKQRDLMSQYAAIMGQVTDTLIAADRGTTYVTVGAGVFGDKISIFSKFEEAIKMFTELVTPFPLNLFSLGSENIQTELISLWTGTAISSSGAIALLSNQSGVQIESLLKKEIISIQETVESVIAPTKTKIERFISNATNFLADDEDGTVSYSGNTKSDIKKSVKEFYDNYIDSSRTTNKKDFVYNSHGSQESGLLGGKFKYTKTNDVQTTYFNEESGSNVENASVGMKRTAQNIKIDLSSGSSEAIDINLNTLDTHASCNLDPKKGNLYVSGGAEYDVASVGLTAGDATEGVGSVSLHAKAGVGASGTVGIKDGILKVEGSVAFGLGADISIEINYKHAWNQLCDMFKAL